MDAAAQERKVSRIAILEQWRSSAFALGGPIGHLLSKTFDLIQTVVRDGIGDQTSLEYALESLTRERELASARDAERAEPLRHLLYGLIKSLSTMVESVIEEQRGAVVQQPTPTEWTNEQQLMPDFFDFPKDEEPSDNSEANSVVILEEEDAKMASTVPQSRDESSSIEDQPCSSRQAQSQSRTKKESGSASEKRSRLGLDDDVDVNEAKWEAQRRIQLRPRKRGAKRTSNDKHLKRLCASGPIRYFEGESPEEEEEEEEKEEWSTARCKICSKRMAKDLLEHHTKYAHPPQRTMETRTRVSCPYCDSRLAAAFLKEHLRSEHGVNL